jgi:hypothetical protein
LQTPAERREEARIAEAARAREWDREAVRGFAQEYARLTGDPKAVALIHEYVQQRSPRLDRSTIQEMREALRVAGDPGGDYLALPEAVRNRCLGLCFALEQQGDGRLIEILDAAERRGVDQQAFYDRFPGLTREDEDAELLRGEELDPDVDFDDEYGPRRGR